MLLVGKIMDEKGISRSELADRTGVSATTITNIRKGHNFPKYDLLLKIAEELDVDVRELFPSTKPQEVSHSDTEPSQKLELLKKLAKELELKTDDIYPNMETIYIQRDGELLPVGKILKMDND